MQNNLRSPLTPPDQEEDMLESARPDSPGRGPSILLGAILGAAVGFALRPSNILTGQLDLETVLMRGANLTGLDQLLKSQAEASSNMLLLCAVVGAALGYAIAKGREK
jgi:uncharacterized membrane protein (Fun14 family)